MIVYELGLATVSKHTDQTASCTITVRAGDSIT